MEGALKSRQEHVALDSALLKAEPNVIDRIQRMAFALTGLASMKYIHGDIGEAMANLEKSLGLLNKILVQDVDARDTTVSILARQQDLARLMALNGETDEAWEALNEISDKWLELKGISEEDMRTSLIYVEFLINQARLAKSRGDTQLANQLLNDIQLHLVASQSNMSFKRRAENMLVEAVFLQWEMNGELPPANIFSYLPEYVPGSGRARACDDASKAAIKSVMLGQMAQAQEFTDYLLEKGYREAGFMRICKQYSLCSGQ